MTRLIILEGPDGAGKTTLAKELQKLLPTARLLHFNRQSTLTADGLGRMYVEAMLPAVMGWEDVIMDRSWLSEKPYADAYWNGDDRLGTAGKRMLERIAMKAHTCVVRMDPGWNVVHSNWKARKDFNPESELLNDSRELKQVYDAYKEMYTALPVINYDYQVGDTPYLFKLIQELSTAYHPVYATAGNWRGDYLIVTPDHPPMTDKDSFYRWPMTEFSGAGESRWVANQLTNIGVSEDRLLWVTHDKLRQALRLDPQNQFKKVLALGGLAASACRELGVQHVELPHPTGFRRDMGKNLNYFGALL